MPSIYRILSIGVIITYLTDLIECLRRPEEVSRLFTVRSTH